MSNYRISKFSLEFRKKWQDFVKKSNGGTIFHDLDFLSYHGDRFKDHENHLMWFKGDNLFAVMPMAVFEEGQKRIARSPYGGSYGGSIFENALNLSESNSIVSLLLEYLIQCKIDECYLVLPLSCCYKKYSETFLFSLLSHGFKCINRDISSVICLDCKNPISDEMTSRVRNMARKVRKARKAGVISVNRGNVSDFWIVMEKTFAKHHAKPTHTLEEFRFLNDHLPDNFFVDVAFLGKKPIAGIGYAVINTQLKSTFYLCQDPEFQSTQAQSLLIYEAILESQRQGYKWFELGLSSTNMVPRDNIFRFKEGFGAIGQFRETYIFQTL